LPRDAPHTLNLVALCFVRTGIHSRSVQVRTSIHALPWKPANVLACRLHRYRLVVRLNLSLSSGIKITVSAESLPTACREKTRNCLYCHCSHSVPTIRDNYADADIQGSSRVNAYQQGIQLAYSVSSGKVPMQRYCPR
jgi:hypothetical protein